MDYLYKIIENINFEVIFAILTSLVTVLIKLRDKIYFNNDDKKIINADADIEENSRANSEKHLGEAFQRNHSNEVVIINNSKVQSKEPLKRKPKVLKIFILIALLYLAITTAVNWDNIVITKNTLLLYIGLFLMMCGGMFVSVIRKNYKTSKELFDVRDSDLIYPLLFSVFVFYPLLLMVESEQNSKLLFYTAFLNGYFWKTIVTEAEENVKEKDDKIK